MANEQNLKSWKKGQSGNPAGRPKGSKNLSTQVREFMSDESLTTALLSTKPPYFAQLKDATPQSVITASLIQKAMEGDLKATELLYKIGYLNKVDAEELHAQCNSPAPRIIDVFGEPGHVVGSREDLNLDDNYGS